MKSYYKSLSLVFAAITSAFCLPAHSAYQYTYTSSPFESYSNNFLGGGGFNFSNDSFLKIVITSENILEEYAANPFENATYDFIVEDFNYRARPGGSYGDTVVGGHLLITDIENGLPNRFFLSYSESYNSYNTTPYTTTGGIDFYADANRTQFSFFRNTGQEQFRLDAFDSQGGTWSLSEVTSPVPEPETYAMLLAGLGLIGFIGRRSNKAIR